jgi:hypothetical protein
MPEATTSGLVDNASAATAITQAQWAAAGGSADAITAAYPIPNTALTDGLILGFRASAANATATPTFAPDGLTAYTITDDGGTALSPGVIPAANAEMLVRYNLANTRWELLNPNDVLQIPWVVAGGTGDAITATYAPAVLSLTDGLMLAFRASAANTLTNPTFAPNGLTAHAITKRGGAVLAAGDIPAAGAEVLLRYNLANTRWETVSATASLRQILSAIAVAGGNVNTAQPWFPSSNLGTVQPGTYRFSGFLFLSRAAGASSHTTALLFGGTAVLTSIGYVAFASTADALALVAADTFYASAATALVVKAASTSTTEQAWFQVEGIVVIGTAGTFIPQFIYSAAPGGAPTITAGFELVNAG